MKKASQKHLLVLCTLVSLAVATPSSFATSPAEYLHSQPGVPKTLEGMAEDLWGSKIELSDYTKGLTLIQPFSPSNCGYCLKDGRFIRENYFRNNEGMGHNFLQCLFNPQLDIYAFIKHYRESTPVLTFPPALHQYHLDGFPSMIAARDGSLIYSGHLFPYEEIFRSLRSVRWPGKAVPMTPTSALAMAATLISNNFAGLAIKVYSDGDEAGLARAGEGLKKLEARVKEINLQLVLPYTIQMPYAVKHESQLSDTDYGMNLRFYGVTERFSLEFLEGNAAPVQITPESVRIGGHEFPKSDVGVAACFPNPCNKERYVVLGLHGSKLKSRVFESWTDYTIYKDGSDGKPEILLHGFFGKDGANWRFSPALALGTAVSRGGCDGSVCPAPSGALDGSGPAVRRIKVSRWTTTPCGKIRTLGASKCRFPAMAVDSDGICWVTWEEDGNILLASVNAPEPQRTVAVERDLSDSYNPIITYDGSRLWVLYLNNRDGFYRLYARFFDGIRLSEPALITELRPLDVITPAVASDGKGNMTVAWTEWKANYRYLRYRTLADGSLGEAHDVAIATSDIDYVNAWYPSLVIGEGQCWGAWNQHYPAMLGVCSGNLVEEATSVTRIVGNIDRNECGGYPSIVIDKQGRRWVFWESYGWDVLQDEAQRILGSRSDESSKKWTLPDTLSVESQTALNQTPRAAVDDKGTIWVVWSGRQNDITKPWGIYISSFSGGRWSAPELISQKGVNSRAPNMCIGKGGAVWVTWHAGTGSHMKIKVLQYER